MIDVNLRNISETKCIDSLKNMKNYAKFLDQSTCNKLWINRKHLLLTLWICDWRYIVSLRNNDTLPFQSLDSTFYISLYHVTDGVFRLIWKWCSVHREENERIYSSHSNRTKIIEKKKRRWRNDFFVSFYLFVIETGKHFLIFEYVSAHH
jgi:hypothetical protein